MNQRGNGRLGVFLFLVALAAGLFVGVRAIPVRIAVLQLHDFVDEQSKLAAAASRPDEARIVKNILAKAAELEIPLTKKDVKYKRTSSSVVIRIRHSVTIDLSVYEWTWAYDKKFEHIRI